MIFRICVVLTLAKICKFCGMDYDTNTVKCNSLVDLAGNSTYDNVTQLEVVCSSGDKSARQVDLTRFSNVTTVQIHDCGLVEVPAIDGLDKLTMLNVTGNNISAIHWQNFRRPNLKIDIQQNPINCNDCQNKWLNPKQFTNQPDWDYHQIFGLSRYIFLDRSMKNCSFDHCHNETISASPSGSVHTTLGATINITCHIDSSRKRIETTNLDTNGIFIWPLQNSNHDEGNLNISFDDQNVYLAIKNLTSHELGFIACICTYCDFPIFDIVELHFDTNVSISLVEDLHDSHLIVHGYPLVDLNLTIFRYADNRSETHQIFDDSDKISFFNGSLLVKYEKGLSHYFLKYFTIFVRACTDCEYIYFHINGIYAFEVCSAQNCAFIDGRVDSVPTPNSPPNFPSSNDPNTLRTILIVILFFLLFLLVATLFSTLHIKRELIKKGWELKGRRASRNTATTEETRLEETSLVYSRSISNYIIQHVPLIERNSLELKDRIGKGAFGEVHIANWSERNCQVAVKMLHNVQIDAEMDKEAALLAHLEHPNVVKLFGICRWDTGQVVLVLEMMNLGDLKTYLRDRTPRCNNYSQFPPALLTTELINISTQVCTGLCYITNQNIVHRDLAARNCLVSGDTDMKVCSAAFRPPFIVKISDFGMSRRLYSDVEYYRMQDKKTALPVRWLPPECLSSGKFSTMSDMWSFGVCLFEIFSFGGVPFGDLSNSEVVSALITGVLPNIPSNCPQVIREIIDCCWKKEPEERITAFQALDRLQSMQSC